MSSSFAAPEFSLLAMRLRAAGLADDEARIDFHAHAPAYARAAALARWSFAVHVNGAPRYHLTAAADLSDSAARTRAFADACPEIACRVLAFLPDAAGDLLVSEHFAGEPLDHVVARGDCAPERWLAAVRRVMTVLNCTESESSTAARDEQIARWMSSVRRLNVIPESALVAMDDALRGALPQPARARWTNGDFTGRNLLVDARSEVRLVDTEFAQCSHFPGNDWRRLLQFSHLPDGVSAETIPECSEHRQPAADLAFWLEHLGLLAQVTDHVAASDLALILRHLGNAHYLLTGARLALS